MSKTYLNKNVYESAQERLAYIFDNFDNVLVAFSGGKDSGVYDDDYEVLDDDDYSFCDDATWEDRQLWYINDVVDVEKDLRLDRLVSA